MIKDLSLRIRLLGVGSCTCGTKMPTLELHAPNCQYRRLVELSEEVAVLEAERAKFEIALIATGKMAQQMQGSLMEMRSWVREQQFKISTRDPDFFLKSKTWGMVATKLRELINRPRPEEEER